ncbi:hypothetical protein Ciccas_013863, partial [Cichlidogyrus casuarinus]
MSECQCLTREPEMSENVIENNLTSIIRMCVGFAEEKLEAKFNKEMEILKTDLAKHMENMK